MLEIKLKNTYKKLIHYFSIFTIIFGTTFGSLNSAYAADGTDASGIEVDDAGATIVGSATGLLESDGALAIGFEITTDAGDLTFGASGGVDAITITEVAADVVTTITVTGGNAAIFAGDIELDDADDDLIIAITEAGTSATIGNNVIGDVVIKLGVVDGDNITNTLIIDNLADENQSVATTSIVGVDSDDTSALVFRSTGTGTSDNVTTVSGVIGGAANAIISSITVGDTNGQDVLVKFTGTALTTSAITLGNGGATADTIKLTIDKAGAANLTVAGTINGSATDTTTLEVIGDGNNATIFSGAIGGTTALSSVLLGTEDGTNNTITFNGTLKASTITLGNADATTNDTTTVNFTNAAAATIAGTISEAASTEVTAIVVSDSDDGADGDLVTFSDNVTVDTLRVGISGDKSGNAKFSGDVTVTTLTVIAGDANEIAKAEFVGNVTGEVNLDNIDDGALVIYSGTSATTQTGIVHSLGGDEGIIQITNTAGTTFTEAVGTGGAIGQVEIAATGKATFNKVLDTALLTATGTVVIKENDNILDDFDIAATTGTIYIEETVTNGETVFALSDDGDATSVGGLGTAKIYMPVNLSDGQSLKLFTDVIDANADAINADVEAALQDNALINYTATVTGDDDITVTAANKSTSTTASELSVTNNNAKSFLNAYTSAINDTNADADAEGAFQTVLQAGTTTDTDLAKQVAPQDDMISGSTLASKAVTGTVQGIISNRMASLRSGDAYYGMGMSAGNMTAKSGFIQAFGSEVEQKNKNVGSGTQYGYESSSAGFALGFDGTTDTGATVGLSFSMSNTDLDGKGTGKAKNDIDSYTASLYWDKTGQNGYVEGSLTYGLNENKTSRLVNTAGLSRTYTGSYDSNQLSLSLGGGAPNAVGASGYVTPFIGVTGTYIKTDAYTESSTTAGDSLRLRVAQDDINSLVGKVGVKYHNVTDKGTPMISLSLNNEFGDDTINSTNTYQGGGSSFTTSTDVEPLSATLGLGYSYGSDTASIEFAYEAEANDDKYLGHYGSIKIVGKF